MERLKSKKMWDLALKVMPGGVSSPIRSFKEVGIHPLVVDRADKDLIYDVDQHPYIDFCMSYGAMILGHSHPEVVHQVRQQIEKGTTYGTTSKGEIELAEWMHRTLPCCEKVRFVSSGTEAVMTAIRLARGFTGAKTMIKFDANYHGAVDSVMASAGSYLKSTPSASGVLEDAVRHTISLPYNDEEALTAFFERYHEPIAAILIEPVAANMGVVPASGSFLRKLREFTRERNALLIFDEVISGFRVAYGGAQEVYGVTADLVCYGKIIGGGYPLAAVAGRGVVMDCLAPLGPVYQAGTLSGNPVGAIAGLTVLKELSRPGFYDELFGKTESFLKPIRTYIQDQQLDVAIQSMGAMFTIFFGTTQVAASKDLVDLDALLFKKFFQTLFVQGIYIPPSPFEACFITSAHTPAHLEKTQQVMMEFLKKLIPTRPVNTLVGV